MSMVMAINAKKISDTNSCTLPAFSEKNPMRARSIPVAVSGIAHTRYLHEGCCRNMMRAKRAASDPVSISPML